MRLRGSQRVTEDGEREGGRGRYRLHGTITISLIIYRVCRSVTVIHTCNIHVSSFFRGRAREIEIYHLGGARSAQGVSSHGVRERWNNKFTICESTFGTRGIYL